MLDRIGFPVKGSVIHVMEKKGESARHGKQSVHVHPRRTGEVQSAANGLKAKALLLFNCFLPSFM